MTTGYPDFQAYAQWRGAALVAQFNTSYGLGTTSYGPFYVGDYASISLFGSVGSTQPLLVAMTFSDDAAGVNTLEVVEWALFNGVQVQCSVPARGNYVKLSVNNVGVSSVPGTFYMQPTNVITPNIKYLGQPQGTCLVNSFGTIAASATTTTQGLWVFGGLAMFSVEDQSNNKWHGRLQFWNRNTQNMQTFAWIDGGGGQQRLAVLVVLPPATVQTLVTNDDTVSHSFAWTLATVQ